jgi:hypothetical protein
MPNPDSEFPTHCHCGAPVQVAADHRCRQCAAHCEIERYRSEQRQRSQEA